MKTNDQQLTVEIKAEEHESPNVLSPDAKMVGWTWLTFFLLLVVLYKFAWNPILANLDAREETIKRSLDDAKKIKEEMERLEERRVRMIKEADEKAVSILEQARKAAHETARTIEQSAKEYSQIVLENATREIHEEKEKAKAELKEESASLAIELAGKLIKENLDDDKNRKIVNEFIKRI